MLPARRRNSSTVVPMNQNEVTAGSTHHRSANENREVATDEPAADASPVAVRSAVASAAKSETVRSTIPSLRPPSETSSGSDPTKVTDSEASTASSSMSFVPRDSFPSLSIESCSTSTIREIAGSATSVDNPACTTATEDFLSLDVGDSLIANERNGAAAIASSVTSERR